MKASREVQQLMKIWKTPRAFYKYEELPEFKRIKQIGYYCGTDYADKKYYHYNGFTSRFDHSKIVGDVTFHFTNDFTKAMAGYTHDIGSSCFSHTIDYMNKDYVTQESTEEKTKEIILGSKKMLEYFKQDGVDVDKLFEYHEGNSIVNNKRPKLCMDRIDGIITPALTWLEIINLKEAKALYRDLVLYTNEDGEEELSFKHESSIKRIIELNQIINDEIQSDYDFYFMDTLANIVKELIDKEVITYNQLYILTEPQLIQIIETYGYKHPDFYAKWYEFQHASSIPKRDVEIKNRTINPILKLDFNQIIRYN